MRLVKTAASKRSPRCAADRGCATTPPSPPSSHPRSTSSRSTRCSSTGPGRRQPAPPGTTSPSLPEQHAQRADRRCARSGTVEQVAQHADRGGLAVGAGDPDHAELARRLAVRRRRGDAAARRPSRTTSAGSDRARGIFHHRHRGAGSRRARRGKSCPSRLSPRTAMNSAAGRDGRLSSRDAVDDSGSAPRARTSRPALSSAWTSWSSGKRITEYAEV